MKISINRRVVLLQSLRSLESWAQPHLQVIKFAQAFLHHFPFLARYSWNLPWSSPALISLYGMLSSVNYLSIDGFEPNWRSIGWGGPLTPSQRLGTTFSTRWWNRCYNALWSDIIRIRRGPLHLSPISAVGRASVRRLPRRGIWDLSAA